MERCQSDGKVINYKGTMVLLKGSEEVVASPDIAIFIDYRYIADPGGRIGCRSFDIHAVLRGKCISCYDDILKSNY